LRHWVKRNPADCIAIARGKFYFQRKNGFEMTVRLNATDCPENRHIVAAANAVADALSMPDSTLPFTPDRVLSLLTAKRH